MYTFMCTHTQIERQGETETETDRASETDKYNDSPVF